MDTYPSGFKNIVKEEWTRQLATRMRRTRKPQLTVTTESSDQGNDKYVPNLLKEF